MNDFEIAYQVYIEGSDFQFDKKIFLKFKALHKKFLIAFPKENLQALSLSNYPLGIAGNNDTFCNWIENKLNNYGNIHGSVAKKFGVYFGKWKDSNKTWQWAKKWGLDEQEAMTNIAIAIHKLVNEIQRDDHISLNKSPISPLFKCKILSLYYLDDFIPIYSIDHLNRILCLFGNSESYNNPFEANKLILKLYSDSNVFNKYDIFFFSSFLYRYFSDEIYGINVPQKAVAEASKNLEKVNFSELIEKVKSETAISKNRKYDYEKINKAKMIAGFIAEKIVFEYERKMIGNKFNVEHRSLKDDSLGYDILSYNIMTHEEKHIEVKTLSDGSLNKINFFISENELKQLRSDEYYVIYFVYGVSSDKPCFLEIRNNDLAEIEPKPIHFQFNLAAK